MVTTFHITVSIQYANEADRDYTYLQLKTLLATLKPTKPFVKATVSKTETVAPVTTSEEV